MHPTECNAYFNDMMNQYDELIIWLLPLSGNIPFTSVYCSQIELVYG